LLTVFQQDTTVSTQRLADVYLLQVRAKLLSQKIGYFVLVQLSVSAYYPT